MTEETAKPTKTLRDLAQEAIDVQNACNLSGVVHSFSRAVTELRRLEPNKDTSFYNTHPIAVLYASKIADLAGAGSFLGFENAYDAAKLLAAQEG